MEPQRTEVKLDNDLLETLRGLGKCNVSESIRHILHGTDLALIKRINKYYEDRNELEKHRNDLLNMIEAVEWRSRQKIDVNDLVIKMRAHVKEFF